MMNSPAFGRSITGGHQRTPGMAPGLAAFGRHGDTMLAHINPEEAELLKARGGAGTRNPHTGLPEFFMGSGEMGERESGFGGRSGRSGGGIQAKGRSSFGPGRAMGFGGSPEIGGSRVDTVGGYGRSPGLAGFGGGTGASTRGFNILGRTTGLGARPALDPTTRMPTAQATFNPVAAATMGIASPGFADIGLGHGFEAGGHGSAARGQSSGQDRKSMGRSLVNAVLGKEEVSEAPPPPAAEPRKFVPFQGDYLTYGQPGGVASHNFFPG